MSWSFQVFFYVPVSLDFFRVFTIDVSAHIYNIVGSWWPICWVDTVPPKCRGFESRSSRHLGALGKSFTHSWLWRFGVKLR